jgi:hypothetical protein
MVPNGGMVERKPVVPRGPKPGACGRYCSHTSLVSHPRRV